MYPVHIRRIRWWGMQIWVVEVASITTVYRLCGFTVIHDVTKQISRFAGIPMDVRLTTYLIWKIENLSHAYSKTLIRALYRVRWCCVALVVIARSVITVYLEACMHTGDSHDDGVTLHVPEVLSRYLSKMAGHPKPSSIVKITCILPLNTVTLPFFGWRV